MAEIFLRPKERHGSRGLVGPTLAIFLSAAMLLYAGEQLLEGQIGSKESTPEKPSPAAKPQSSLLIPLDFKTSLTEKVVQAAQRTFI